MFVFQTCDIKAEGRKRFLTLKNVQLDQAGEVSYQALNAITSAVLTVKGTSSSLMKPVGFLLSFVGLGKWRYCRTEMVRNAVSE